MENVGIKRGNIDLTGKLITESRKRILRNAVFIVSDKYTENSKKMTLIPLTLPNPGRVTGNWKSYWNYWGSYGKAIEKPSADLSKVYNHDKF